MKTTVTPPAIDRMTPSWSLVPPSLRLIRQNFEAVTFLILLPSLLLDLGYILLTRGNWPLHNFALTGRQQGAVALIAAGAVWSLINLGPSTLFQITAVKGKHLTLAEYYRQGLRYIWRLLGFNILFGFMMLVGLVLLIVPGLIILRRYYLGGFYIVDQDLSIREAMRRSAEESKPVKGYVWGIFGVRIVFSLIGGVFAKLPVFGIIIEELVVYICLFLPALRYSEIVTADSSR